MKEKLLKFILSNTINGTIKWSVHNSMFNSDTSHRYECVLRDGSIVRVEVNLNKDTLSFGNCGSLVINNPDLVNRSLMLFEFNYSMVTDIGRAVYDTYIKSIIKPRVKTQDEILEGMMASSIEEIRDDKIEEIITGKKKKLWPFG